MRFGWRTFLVLGALLGACDNGTGDADAGADAGGRVPATLPPAPAGFTRNVIDALGDGPAFSSVGDLNGDQRLDIVTGHLGHPTGGRPPPGRVTAYLQGDSLASWTAVDIVPLGDEVPFPSEPTIHDFDKDGDLDVMIPAGFLVCTLFERQCGSLIWYENDGRAGGWAPHVIVPPGDRLFYHRAEIVDFDGDSIEDLVTIGEYFSASSREALTVWFKGTNDALRFETTARPIGEGGGSLPTVLDLDGDGDLDVASANFFLPNESAIWFERTGNPNSAEPNGRFEKHIIDAEAGPSIQLSFVTIDSVRYAILSNHTSVHRNEGESAVYMYRVPTGPAVREPWPRTTISQGIVSRADEGQSRQAAPGIFGTGDIDMDGDVDVLLSGDGDAKVYWLEQTAPDQWATRVLQEGLGQAGSTIVADFDRDGRNEMLVSGFEHDVVMIYDRD